MECQFCKNFFSSSKSLKAHQKRTKYCLEIQSQANPLCYKCKGCLDTFNTAGLYEKHKQVCTKFAEIQIVDAYEKKIEEQRVYYEQRCTKLEEKNEEYAKNITHLQFELHRQREHYMQRIIDLQDHKLESLLHHISNNSNVFTSRKWDANSTMLPSNTLTSAHCM